MELNDQARAYLEAHPPLPDVDVGTEVNDFMRELDRVRRRLDKEYSDAREEYLAVYGEPEPVAAVEEFSLERLPACLYRPVGGEREVLVWLHGGGWLGGNVQGYDIVLRALANRAGCAILAVDYRLAPEYRYPAGIDDCWAATVWAAAHFDHVAVGGDSAGGNLTAAVTLRARNGGGPQIALQLLIQPVTNGEGLLAGDGLSWHGWIYLNDPAEADDPLVVPLAERDLTGLPPAFVVTATCDELHAEGQEYARRLEAAGVPVELVDYEGQIHGFLHLLGAMDDAHDAVDRSAAALRTAFAKAREGKAAVGGVRRGGLAHTSSRRRARGEAWLPGASSRADSKRPRG
jgi:acetyl esterase